MYICNVYVYVMYLHVSGFMSELEYDVLSEWFGYLVHSADIRAIDLFGNCRSLSLLVKILQKHKLT